MKTKIIILLFALYCGSVLAQIPKDGLVLYYPFNGNANDESTSEFNATVTGAELTTDRFGVPNSAYNLNGYSKIASTAVGLKRIFDNVNTYSINFWFNTTSNSPSGNSGQMILFACDGTNPWPYKRTWIGVYQKDTSSVIYYQRYNASTMQAYGGVGVNWKTSSLLTGVWYHLSINYDRNNIYAYLNGVELPIQDDGNWFTGTKDHATTMGNADNLTLGTAFGDNYQDNQEHYNGKLDDIRIYNRKLELTEISALWNEGKYIEVYDTVKVYHIDTLIVHEPVYDTLLTYDTIPIYKEISVTDTLFINVNLATGIQLEDINTLKVYPNPAKDFLTINTGNYSNMSDYSIKITNELGQFVFERIITQPEYNIDLSSWSGKGLYVLRVYDNNNMLKSVKKIILQ